MRDTSIAAYNSIRDNGLLPRRRWQCYDIIYRHGPLTRNQLVTIAGREQPGRPYAYLESLTKRLPEMRVQGVLREVSEDCKCPITGQTVILWDVTSRLPDPLPKRKSRIQIAIENERLACAQIAFTIDDIIGQIIGNKILKRGQDEQDKTF